MFTPAGYKALHLLNLKESQQYKGNLASQIHDALMISGHISVCLQLGLLDHCFNLIVVDETIYNIDSYINERTIERRVFDFDMFSELLNIPNLNKEPTSDLGVCYKLLRLWSQLFKCSFVIVCSSVTISDCF